MAPIGEQDSTGYNVGSRTSKSPSPFEKLGSMILRGYCGAKGLKTPAHFISGLRPMPKKKNFLRTNEGNPDQDTLPRTTLSSVDQNCRRGRRHIARGSPLEDPKGDFKPNGSTIGAW